MADVIAHFPKFTEATNIYGYELIQLVPEYDIETAKNYLDNYQADMALTMTAANNISQKMNGHDMFNIHLDLKTNIISYEGFDCWNRSCGTFTQREALACALIMIHGNLGMMVLNHIDGMVINNFKYSDNKFAQILD